MGKIEWEELLEDLALVMDQSSRMSSIRKNNQESDIAIDPASLPYKTLPLILMIGARYSAGLKGTEPESEKKQTKEKMLGMASIFQLVYHASHVHNIIGAESDDGIRPGCTPRDFLPVLIGDYIFGRLLKRLCEIECTERLPQLAEVISQMNKGGIQRRLYLQKQELAGDKAISVLELEYGSLFAEAGRFGIWLFQGGYGMEILYGEVCRKFGIYVGARHLGIADDLTEYCRNQAVNSREQLPEDELKRTLVKLFAEMKE